ncbi:uncharacterized protein PFLUO_LOCUS6135 [Penicillium psychrofluorescens]|uniref:uncharacterized protein n=1 Tax=Penicillium psychrofluorescens TaxID=3158075 RepID=UPI003CCDB7F4
MCDSSFKASTLADLLIQQSTWTSGQKIDDLNTAGADFQHEMFHYINQGIVDKLTPGGNRAYGWANCALLASKSDEGVKSAQLYNADNYRLFALAVFFDRTWWNAQGQKY